MSSFGIAVLLFMGAVAAVFVAALVVGWVRGRLFFFDGGTLLLCPPVFLGVGMLRPEFRVGFGGILGLVIAVMSVSVLFTIRIFIVDPVTSSAERNAKVLFVGCLVASALLGVFMPPVYE